MYKMAELQLPVNIIQILTCAKGNIETERYYFYVDRGYQSIFVLLYHEINTTNLRVHYFAFLNRLNNAVMQKIFIRLAIVGYKNKIKLSLFYHHDSEQHYRICINPHMAVRPKYRRKCIVRRSLHHVARAT